MIPSEEVTVGQDGKATVPVRVHFKTSNTEAEMSETAQFVKHGSVWYFSNFNFLAFPVAVIVVIIGCVLFGITYAAIVLVLRARLVRQGRLVAANWIKIFIPVFWPSLFREGQGTRM